ncbi:MAG: hypothetical protein QF541_23000, partial [Lentisphaeria bacterium]|nr:hypothetical protein [Lentisphaeria bacterium]
MKKRYSFSRPLSLLVILSLLLGFFFAGAPPAGAGLARFVRVSEDRTQGGWMDSRFHLGELEAFADGDTPDDQGGGTFGGMTTSTNDVQPFGFHAGTTTTTVEHGSPANNYNNATEGGGAVWSCGNGQGAPEPRYTLDLGGTFDITTVRMWPRADTCCTDRWQNLLVELIADNGGSPGATNDSYYIGTPGGGNVPQEVTFDPAAMSIENLAASGMTSTSATFHATLKTAVTNSDVYVHWGPIDGTTNFTAWSNTAYVGSWTNVTSTNINLSTNGLTSGTQYYYTFRATNDSTNVWASPSTNFWTHGAPGVDNAGGAIPGSGTAALQGRVVSTGGVSLTHVRIYFGLSDGGTNPGSWDTNYVFNAGSITEGVAFSTNVGGLIYGIEYNYRTYASNTHGEAWADTATFTALPPAGEAEISIYREVTGTDNIPQGSGSAFECDWDTTVREHTAAHSLQGDNKSVTCSAGHHLVMYSVRCDRTSTGNRSEAQGQLRLNGSDLPIGWSQLYTRTDQGNVEAILTGGGIIEVASDNDLLVLRAYRTDNQGGAGAMHRAADASGIQLMKLDDDLDYCRLSRSADQTGPINATWVAVQYDTQDELDTGSFAHNTGTNPQNITLKTAGHYLVFANTYGFCTKDRTILKHRLLLDTVEIDGSRTTVYIRGNQNSCQEGAAAIGMIIETVSDNQVLTVEGSLDVDRNPFTYKADKTAVTIVKLPDSGEYIRLDHSADTFDFNQASTQPVPWDLEDEKDDTAFTHDNAVNNTRVTVDKDDDYLFLTALYDDNDGNQRLCYWQRWRTDGSAIFNYGHAGRFARNSGGA